MQRAGDTAYAHEILVTPRVSQNIGKYVLIGNGRNTVVGVVRAHDGKRPAVDDGTLERGEIGCQQLAPAAVNGTQVDALLRGCESREVLDHGGHALFRLEALDIGVGELPRPMNSKVQ